MGRFKIVTPEEYLKIGFDLDRQCFDNMQRVRFPIDEIVVVSAEARSIFDKREKSDIIEDNQTD
jgi:hypothetical protein